MVIFCQVYVVMCFHMVIWLHVLVNYRTFVACKKGSVMSMKSFNNNLHVEKYWAEAHLSLCFFLRKFHSPALDFSSFVVNVWKFLHVNHFSLIEYRRSYVCFCSVPVHPTCQPEVCTLFYHSKEQFISLIFIPITFFIIFFKLCSNGYPYINRSVSFFVALFETSHFKVRSIRLRFLWRKFPFEVLQVRIYQQSKSWRE